MKRKHCNFKRISCSDVLVLVIIGLFIAYIFIALIYRPINKVTNERQVTVTVVDKGIKNYVKQSKYLIFSQDESGEMQVFEISDSLFKLRFDSADVYGKISKDKTYRFTVAGSRVRIFSWYPNIYEVEEAEAKSEGN